jgi:hercynylcysteine S-oxide lyase
VGYSVAPGEHLAAGPGQIRDRLAQLGRMTRIALTDIKGWRGRATRGADSDHYVGSRGRRRPAKRVRAWLIAERGIVTTDAEVQRAPFEMTGPVLRASPHLDTTEEDLERFAEELAVATQAS